ncbi:MAG: cation:proton antiporter [Candidatus Omnitrophota bacterium]|jgi:Kef-type K+ transport system membrane component KefB
MIQNPILSLAVVFLLGLLSSRLIKKFNIPTITAYVALGIILSPGVLNVISPEFIATSEFFSNVVLGMIAFVLGEGFSLSSIRRVGKSVASISLTASILPWLAITFASWFIFKQPFQVALILGAIASATDPATTVLVSQEYRAKGKFTDTLLGIVAIDDAWALMIFGLSLALAKSFANSSSTTLSIIGDASKALAEIGGSFILGWLVAVVFNKLSKLISTSKERLIYTLGFLSLAIGLSIFFHFSILLTCMFFGAVLANMRRDNTQFFDSLREIDAPLYLIFFVLAGASLKINVLGAAVAVTLGFIFFRTISKISGAYLGAYFSGASKPIRNYMGLALIPQAGVALACALIAKYSVGGDMGDKILTVTIASTVVFELVGPLATKFSLTKAGEVHEEIKEPVT